MCRQNGELKGYCDFFLFVNNFYDIKILLPFFSLRRWFVIKFWRARVLLDRQTANKGIRPGRDGTSEVSNHTVPADLLRVGKFRVCDRKNDVS